MLISHPWPSQGFDNPACVVLGRREAAMVGQGGGGSAIENLFLIENLGQTEFG
jgi:hypothetical protein